MLDAVLIAPGEWWTGYHYVSSTVQRWPGGAIPIRMAPGAVSRAFLKMEEAIQWSVFPLSRDDEIVEIGCAPGGASQALLQRGLFVTGIDPAEVRAEVLPADVFGAWDPITGAVASAGTLTVGFDDSDVDLDLCKPAVEPGYLGNRNNTYRIKVSQPGRFVWGEDNGGTTKPNSLRRSW